MMIIFSVFAVPLSLSESLWWNIGQGLLIAIDLLTIVCLFYGLRAEKHLFLLPYIVYQVSTGGKHYLPVRPWMKKLF